MMDISQYESVYDADVNAEIAMSVEVAERVECTFCGHMTYSLAADRCLREDCILSPDEPEESLFLDDDGVRNLPVGYIDDEEPEWQQCGECNSSTYNVIIGECTVCGWVPTDGYGREVFYDGGI